MEHGQAGTSTPEAPAPFSAGRTGLLLSPTKGHQIHSLNAQGSLGKGEDRDPVEGFKAQMGHSGPLPFPLSWNSVEWQPLDHGRSNRLGGKGSTESLTETLTEHAASHLACQGPGCSFSQVLGESLDVVCQA